MISIHAPMKGATSSSRPRMMRTAKFQSTHPWRVRLIAKISNLLEQLISIHAPMKGATAQKLLYMLQTIQFQSTHPWRVRPCFGSTGRNLTVFQSTHPWRVRPALSRSPLHSTLDFNPRTHEGCDTALLVVPFLCSYFNPRTHEGCDSLQINSVIACFSIIYIANWEKANLIFWVNYLDIA